MNELRDGMPEQLTTRFPQVAPADLITGFVPPPQFAQARFDTYRPDPAQPSQAAAVETLRQFAAQLNTRDPKPRFFRRAKAAASADLPGVYLDGGFGVGKTHLLASLWFATEAAGARAFGTFVEYTNLVGAIGFEAAVSALSQFALVCIDEFELDDPGDTVLMSSLLTRLAEQGVRLAATSNTLPDKLGEGRFAADDFLREIQGLSAKFAVVRIDGEDYRHRGLPSANEPLADAAVVKIAAQDPAASLDTFDELIKHLEQVHPSKYGRLIDGLSTVCLRDVRTLDDQNQALRLVVLVDRLYDRDVRVCASGVPVDQIFTPEMLAGGYRKKYRRAISRLTAMTAVS